MKIENINIDATINEAKRWLKEDKDLPAGFKAIVEILILLISILINRLNLNSSNSSTSPSRDPNRIRKKKKNMTGKKPGGQQGHKGTRLEKFKNPDKIKLIKVDKKTLPPGEYKEVGYESRQVIDIIIKRKITEYRAQVLQDKNGKKYIAPFPKGINNDIQYGDSIKTQDRKSTRLNSSHIPLSRMPSSA